MPEQIHGPNRAISDPTRANGYESICALVFFQFCEFMLSWPCQGQNQKKNTKKTGGGGGVGLYGMGGIVKTCVIYFSFINKLHVHE